MSLFLTAHLDTSLHPHLHCYSDHSIRFFLYLFKPLGCHLEKKELLYLFLPLNKNTKAPRLSSTLFLSFIFFTVCRIIYGESCRFHGQLVVFTDTS